jgi:hypothetical protein
LGESYLHHRRNDLGKTISVHETPDDLLKQIEERVLYLARSAKQAGAP